MDVPLATVTLEDSSCTVAPGTWARHATLAVTGTPDPVGAWTTMPQPFPIRWEASTLPAAGTANPPESATSPAGHVATVGVASPARTCRLVLTTWTNGEVAGCA